MKVLSLFDGIACGREALRRLNADVERYVAYEIEPSAIRIALKNFPDIEERGDVFKADFSEFRGFDLLIGGSPCTNWSIAKAGHGRETTNSGIGWELFSQYIRAWKESGIPYYLYENNASMSKDIQSAISAEFGHEPIEINSALVSAQNRKRLYWTNIPGVSVPEDRGIKLNSVIEHGLVDRDKSLCLARRYAGFQGSQSYLCRRYFGKSMGQAVFEGNQISEFNGNPFSLKALYLSNDRFTDDEGESTGCIIRPMTVVECERLQTLPDGYTDGAECTRVQQIEAIGNGWTVEVIVHLLKGLVRSKYDLPLVEVEPGFVYSPRTLTVLGSLLEKECDELSDNCEVCGKPIRNIKNAVVDVNEKLHPICVDCEMALRTGIKLRDMMHTACVKTVEQLIDWINQNKNCAETPEFMK